MAAHDDGLVFEDDDAPPPRRWADDSDMPPTRKKKKKKKKKKKPPKSLARTALKPALGVAAALALLVAFGGLTYWVATSLTGSPALLPADLWQEQVLGDRFKVSLPGNPKRSTMDLGQGLFARVLLVAVDENTAFSAACTEGKFPPDRAALTVEELLDYPCDGSREVVRQMDPRLTELSRTPVSFEGCPGKQLVLKVPAGSGQMVSRVYYADGRLFIISLVGRGVTADNPNVKYLFDSFKSVPESERKVKPKAEVAAAPVAPPVPPPVVPPPPPPSPPKAVVDPTLPKLAAEFAVLPVGVRAGVLAMGFTPDGKALALGTSEGRAAWYDPDTGKPLTDAGRGGGIDREEVGAVVSPQGDRVAFYRHGGQLYYWERGERAETVLHPGRGGPAQWRAAFSPDGATLCTTHGDQVARIWDVAAGRVRGTLSRSPARSPRPRTPPTANSWRAPTPAPASGTPRRCASSATSNPKATTGSPSWRSPRAAKPSSGCATANSSSGAWRATPRPRRSSPRRGRSRTSKSSAARASRRTASCCSR